MYWSAVVAVVCSCDWWLIPELLCDVVWLVWCVVVVFVVSLKVLMRFVCDLSCGVVCGGVCVFVCGPFV